MAERPLYTDDDVARWFDTIREGIATSDDLPKHLPDRKARVLATLGGEYGDLALSHIARNEYAKAKDALIRSIAYYSDLFDCARRGELEDPAWLEAGSFKEFLSALGTGDWSVVERINAVLPAEFDPRSRSVPSSAYIFRPLKALVEGRIADAQRMLSEPEPKPEAMFRGYTDCLRAIADRDMPRFVAALDGAAASWRKWSSRHERGLPYAVCFLHGAGFVYLAERAVGVPVPETVPDVPYELLHASGARGS
jgi:hypothetical protein